MAIDIYDDYVVLRMRMNGTDGSTTFVEDRGKAVTVVGNVHTEIDQSKFGGTSAYFDGTGDYLTVPHSSDLTFATGDFTVEFWVRPGALSTGQMLVAKRPSQAARGLVIVLASATPTRVTFSVGDSDTSAYEASILATDALSVDTWAHVAAVRYGSTFQLFINGTSQGTATWAGTIDDGTGALHIGISADATSNPFTGYIDDLRITKGVARYTSNFTPPTEEMGMGYSKTVSGLVRDSGNALCQRALRLHRRSDGLLIDEGFSNPTTGAYTLRALDAQKHYVIAHDTEGIDTYLAFDGTNGSTVFTEMNSKTVTPYGNAQISTTQSKFGGSSAYFDGTGDYLQLPPSADVVFPKEDFTMEAWVRVGSFAATNPIAAVWLNGAVNNVSETSWIFYIASATSFGIYFRDIDGAAGWTIVATVSTMSTNTWYHLAITRSGNDYRLFLDGTQQGSTQTNTHGMQSPVNTVMRIGMYWQSSYYYFNGYIDDLRITKGYARYTANFTAPTVPHFDGVTQLNAQILDYITPG